MTPFQLLCLLSFVVCISEATIGVGPEGEFRLIPTGLSQQVVAQAPVFVDGGVPLLSSLDTLNTASNWVSSLYLHHPNSFAYQLFPTNDARGAVFFTIEESNYLAIANGGGTTSPIFRWNSDTKRFVSHQDLQTSSCEGFDYFSFDNGGTRQHFLISSTNKGFGESILYRYNSNSMEFESSQTFTGNPTYDYEFFESRSGRKLLVAAKFDQNSEVFEWNVNSNTFQNVATLITSQAVDVKHFVINNEDYVAISNQNDGSGSPTAFNYHVGIWKLSGSTWSNVYNLSSVAATATEFFTIDGTHYLAVAEGAEASESRIWKWTGSQWEVFQPLQSIGASSWRYLNIHGVHFLALANFRDATSGSGFYVRSRILRWRGTNLGFVEAAGVLTSGATDWEYVNLDGTYYLLVCNSNDHVGPLVDTILYAIN